jgi:hypothetical protein
VERRGGKNERQNSFWDLGGSSLASIYQQRNALFGLLKAKYIKSSFYLFY